MTSRDRSSTSYPSGKQYTCSIVTIMLESGSTDVVLKPEVIVHDAFSEGS